MQKAEKYIKEFEVNERSDGTTFICIKNNDFKSDLYKSVREAHGDRLPQDWIFSTYLSLLEQIRDYDCQTIEDLEDKRSEIVDSLVDVYTYDLTSWLHSDNRNVYYLDEAASEFGTPEDGFKLLAQAQYLAIDEVMSEAISLLSK